jgi:hypothetical protein
LHGLRAFCSVILVTGIGAANIMNNTARTFIASAILVCLQVALPVRADDNRVITANSPAHRVALLELYTSEGCSSCPPADRWLSALKTSDITSEQLIPLAFHVSYWDYIGWKDRFASTQYDQRQRKQAMLANSRSVYTPQFMLNGRDYRGYRNLDGDIRKINDEPGSLDLRMTITVTGPDIMDVRVDAGRVTDSKTAINIALYENGLSSDVSDGENEGEHLSHDYVVRRFYTSKLQKSADNKITVSQSIPVDKDWRKENMGVVAFAQDMDSGEVLQAVRVEMDTRALVSAVTQRLWAVNP